MHFEFPVCAADNGIRQVRRAEVPKLSGKKEQRLEILGLYSFRLYRKGLNGSPASMERVSAKSKERYDLE
jgi:hypothetical protein